MPLHLLPGYDIINIFEDERIETICKNFYLDTDFKEFVKKVNNYHGQKPQSPEQFFYHIVRFEDGPSYFITKAKRLIRQYIRLNRDSGSSICYSYREDVLDFYQEVLQYWTNNKANNQESKQSQESQESKQSQESQESKQSKEIQESRESQESQEQLIEQALEEGLENLHHRIDSMIDTNIQKTFEEILLKKTSSAKTNGSAINSYSGVFDYRSVVRQDYKYFVQKNRLGNVKRFSKIKLNLFIDTSGSFWQSEKIVNKLLYNLAILEKKTTDFRFDVITMSKGEKLLEKNNRKINCCGSNILTNNIIKLYKNVQDTSSTNINIVLFDGDATSACITHSDRQTSIQNFKAFNHQNCIIISNTENEKYIYRHCQAAKKIIVSKDYAELLIKNVIDNLQYGFR